MSAMTCRFKSGLGYHHGVLAQLGEHLPCKQEVSSSILLYSTIRRFSSAGRASALQAEGRRFDPVNLHHGFPIRAKSISFCYLNRVDKNMLHLVLLYSNCHIAGWSSPAARWAHNPKVASSNLAPATTVLWCSG